MDEVFKRIEKIKKKFSACKTQEEVYTLLIELGKNLTPLASEFHSGENRIVGCQSTLYLHSFMKGENLYFEVFSEALISAGLASLLVEVYGGLPPEVILKVAPDFLKDLKLETSLSPNRANGLYQIHLRMKQDALKFLMEKSKKNSKDS